MLYLMPVVVVVRASREFITSKTNSSRTYYIKGYCIRIYCDTLRWWWSESICENVLGVISTATTTIVITMIWIHWGAKSFWTIVWGKIMSPKIGGFRPRCSWTKRFFDTIAIVLRMRRISTISSMKDAFRKRRSNWYRFGCRQKSNTNIYRTNGVYKRFIQFVTTLLLIVWGCDF